MGLLDGVLGAFTGLFGGFAQTNPLLGGATIGLGAGPVVGGPVGGVPSSPFMQASLPPAGAVTPVLGQPIPGVMPQQPLLANAMRPAMGPVPGVAQYGPGVGQAYATDRLGNYAGGAPVMMDPRGTQDMMNFMQKDALQEAWRRQVANSVGAPSRKDGAMQAYNLALAERMNDMALKQKQLMTNDARPEPDVTPNEIKNMIVAQREAMNEPLRNNPPPDPNESKPVQYGRMQNVSSYDLNNLRKDGDPQLEKIAAMLQRGNLLKGLTEELRNLSGEGEKDISRKREAELHDLKVKTMKKQLGERDESDDLESLMRKLKDLAS